MRFYGGRVSLLPLDLFFYFNEEKNKKFDHIVKLLNKNVEVEIRKDTKLIIEPILDDNGILLGGKIARESHADLPLRPDGNLEKVRTKLYPYVLFILDASQQVIFVEKNSQVFQDPIIVFNHLTKYFNSELNRIGIEVHIIPLTHKGKFWNLLDDSAQVYNVNFILKAPNFIGQSHRDFKEILEREKEDVNANQVEFGVSNESGQLRIKKSKRYDAAVGWVEDGGGEWIVKAKKKNQKRKKTFKSSDNLSIFEVELDEIKELTSKIIRTIKEKIFLGAHKIKIENEGEEHEEK